MGAPPFKILVDDQDVHDIIKGILKKHSECHVAYDRIAACFDADDWPTVGAKIFSFLKREVRYEVESDKWQYVSSPQAILTRAVCDCKGYALFTAGVLDAMKRQGTEIDWTYRFASYNLFNRTPGHVFVVIWPGTENEMWIDPVLPRLNSRWPRPTYHVDHSPHEKRDKQIAGIGFISREVGSTSAGLQLGQQLQEYSDGIGNAVQVSLNTNILNKITLGIVQTISYIPMVKAVLGILGVVANFLSDQFGPGSLSARILTDWATNPLTAPVTMVESIFNGRTFESDQYWGAQYYQFYVLGNAKATTANYIPDSGVFPAMKYFMDRLGVFISGREHIEALTKSPQAYIAIAAVNPHTTTDINRVNAAYNVASKYFIFNGKPGSWAQTQGVYDAQLVQVALNMNESIEAAAAQAGYSGVYSAAATKGPATVVSNESGITLPLVPFILGLVGLIIIFQPSKR